jgi:hypothetical protein
VGRSRTTASTASAVGGLISTCSARGSLTCTRIVRNNRTGKYAEVDLNPERPPVDEGDLGRSYAFARGEEVSANHEAVLDAPGAFESVDD